MPNEVWLLHQLLLHSSLTVVSNSLAWDRVPVEAEWLLPSKQKHQEQDLLATHGSHVSTHSLGPALSVGSRDQSDDQGNSREQQGSWQPAERKKIPTHQLGATIHFPYCLGCLSATIFVRVVFTASTFIKKPHKTVYIFNLCFHFENMYYEIEHGHQNPQLCKTEMSYANH